MDDLYIEYDFSSIQEKLSNHLKGISEEEFKNLIPLTYDRQKLIEFYEQTGLTLRYAISSDEKYLIFDRCGAFPDFDCGWGRMLPASGLYFKKDGDLELECDVFIEQRAQYIGVTKDYKHYVIIPEGVDNEEIFEIDEEDEDFDIYSMEIKEKTMYQLDFSLEKFHRFYVKVDTE